MKTELQTCLHCGVQALFTAETCPNCGRAQTLGAESPAAGSPAAGSAKTSRFPTRFFGLLLVLVLVLGVYGFLQWKSHSRSKRQQPREFFGRISVGLVVGDTALQFVVSNEVLETGNGTKMVLRKLPGFKYIDKKGGSLNTEAGTMILHLGSSGLYRCKGLVRKVKDVEKELRSQGIKGELLYPADTEYCLDVTEMELVRTTGNK